MRQFDYQKFILPAAFLCAGILAGFLLGKSRASFSSEPDIQLLHPGNVKYSFINPLTGFELSETQNFPELLDVRKNIENFINNAAGAKKIKSAGVYMRTLKNGHWIGINENEKFYPGSLLKVPIMTAYFKEEELSPDRVFSKELYFPEHNAVDNPAPKKDQPKILTPGKYYTVEELIRHMIIESDNDSKDTLLNNVDLQFFKEAFNDTGIEIPDVPSYTISPKEYSFFFRRLYNATLLSRDSSEKALGLLAQTKFKDGIAAGVPIGVKLAHKFGERVAFEDGSEIENQLHDCGIIYYPENHVLLCVMAKGPSSDGLKYAIQGISKIVTREEKNF